MTENEDVKEAIQNELRYWFGIKYKNKIFSDVNFMPTKKEMLEYYYSHPHDKDLKARLKKVISSG